MPDLKKQTILDVKVGSVIEKNSGDKVILIGSYFDKGSTYIENVEIVINPGDESEPIVTKVDYSGYNLELFLGDFNNDGRDEIMLRGAYGGTGGFAISVVYTYDNGNLKEIFNPKMFSEKYELNANYLEDYMVEVISNTLKEKYTFYIGNKPQIYLSIIYDEEGQVRKYETPTISAINNAFPIKAVYEETYYLFIRQRVIGVSNADTIGFIESFVNLIDNEITIFNIGSFEFGEKTNKTKIEKERDKIEPNKRNEIDFITDDFDMRSNNFIEESEEIKRKKESIESNVILKEKLEVVEELGEREITTIKTTKSVFIDFYNEEEIVEEVINELEVLDQRNEKDRDFKNCEEIKGNDSNLKENIKKNISKEILNKFPIDTVFIDVKNELRGEDFIKEDLDNDGNIETLVPYLLNNSPYIGVVQENSDYCTLKTNFRGEGCTVEELLVKKIEREFYVFAGFKIKEDLNKLYILKLRGGRLTKAFDNNEYYYTKMYLRDLNNDCTDELILWTKKDDGGYYISIYNVKESGLKATSKHDKKYYKEVVDYYKDKIKSYEDTTIYPYYLALAYEKRGEYKKALAIVDKALENKSPYPSKEDLEKFRRRLKKSIK